MQQFSDISAIMTHEEIEKLRELPLFSYMKISDLETLDSCYEMQLGKVPKGTSWETEERFAYLVSGNGFLRSVDADADPGPADCRPCDNTADTSFVPQGERSIQQDNVFGVQPDGYGGCRAIRQVYTAKTDSVILTAESDILRKVCYMACWFHGRFVTEALRRLG